MNAIHSIAVLDPTRACALADELLGLPERSFRSTSGSRLWRNWATRRAGSVFSPARAVEELMVATFALCNATAEKNGGTLASGLVDIEKMNPEELAELKTLFSTSDPQTVGRAARDQAPYRRSYLRSLGAVLLKSGWRASAMGVTAYLIAQPGGEDDLPVELYRLCFESKERGMPVKRAASPWARPP